MALRARLRLAGQPISVKAKVRTSDLLTGVNGLLTGLLTSDPEAAQNLLSLVGVEESKLLGVQMKGDFTMHSSNDFAGGMVGRGDGVVIAASDALM